MTVPSSVTARFPSPAPAASAGQPLQQQWMRDLERGWLAHWPKAAESGPQDSGRAPPEQAPVPAELITVDAPRPQRLEASVPVMSMLSSIAASQAEAGAEGLASPVESASELARVDVVHRGSETGPCLSQAAAESAPQSLEALNDRRRLAANPRVSADLQDPLTLGPGTSDSGSAVESASAPRAQGGGAGRVPVPVPGSDSRSRRMALPESVMVNRPSVSALGVAAMRPQELSPPIEAPQLSAEEQRVAVELPPDSAADGESSERALAIREFEADSVRVSLRDVQLDSTESRQAALGLARAFMQAGYARVQVYVNGQSQQLGALRGDEGEPTQAADFAPTDRQEQVKQEANTHGD